MNEVIYIRGWYGDWYAVNREEALAFARHIFSHITNSTTLEQKVALTNRHIKGVQFSEEELKCRQ